MLPTLSFAKRSSASQVIDLSVLSGDNPLRDHPPTSSTPAPPLPRRRPPPACPREPGLAPAGHAADRLRTLNDSVARALAALANELLLRRLPCCWAETAVGTPT